MATRPNGRDPNKLPLSAQRFRGQRDTSFTSPGRLLFAGAALTSLGLAYSIYTSPSSPYSVFRFFPWAYPSLPPPTTPISTPLVGDLVNHVASCLNFPSPSSAAVWLIHVAQQAVFTAQLVLWRRDIFPMTGDGCAPLITGISFTADAVLTLLYFYTAGRNATWWPSLAGWGLLLSIPAFVGSAYTETEKYLWKGNPKNNGKVLTTGSWSIVRNPNYITSHAWRFTQGLAMLGWPGLLLGWAYLSDSMTNQVPYLEMYMQGTYGEKWDAYKAKVPYRYIPGIW